VLEADLKAAEEQAAADDPHVEQAAAAAEELREQFDTLVTAVDEEAERAQKAVALHAEKRRQAEIAEQSENEVGRLQRIIDERAAKSARLEEIRAEAASASAAGEIAKQWNDLSVAASELAMAESELAEIGYDAAADTETQSRASTLLAEHTSCEERQERLALAKASLEKRIAALEAVTGAGPVEAVREARDHAREAQQQARERLGIEQHELKEDEAHVAAVAEGGGDTPCPVCLRPYGDEHEAILDKYRMRIDERRAGIATLERQEAELSVRLSNLEESVRKAERAADGLADTQGSDDVDTAKAELERTEATLRDLADRLGAIEEERRTVQGATNEQAEARERWWAQEAIKTDRAERAARILEELGIQEYDAEQHAAINTTATRLLGLAGEVSQLSDHLANTEEAEKQKADAEARTRDARTAESQATAALEQLAYDPERLPALKEERDATQTAHNEAATVLAEARVVAQSRSETVRSLGQQVLEARRVRDAIEERALDLERHNVVAGLLTEFRGYQSQRAWPHLEQGASAILSAATDGRYADVSLSDDFRIVVLDRGERHELSRFSGGEQDVTNLCLRLAIAEWVAQERGAEVNFVILDEVFGSQDDERRQLLLGELRALGNRFEQLLVITHLPDIADLCEHELEVVLEEPGRSRVRFVDP
jgi:exonuclease SbcC